MKYSTLLLKNIKNQKGNFIGIFILIFIITVSACAVFTVWNNATDYEREQMDRVGYGDITIWARQLPGLERLEEQIKGLEETEKVTEQRLVFVKYHVNGHDAGGNGLVVAHEPENFDYYIYNNDLTGIQEQPEPLKDGEVYVSPSFGVLYDAEIGDKLEVEITGEKDMETYTIKGFFEDPFMGSSMMGMKTMLVNEKDRQRLKEKMENAGEDAAGSAGKMLHIYKSEESTLKANEFQILLDKETDFKDYVEFIYQKANIEGFMLLLQNVFAGFLLVFVLVLITVAILVISHSITTSIEQDFVDMGILKAIGYTKESLQLVKIMQYVLAILGGMFLGIPASVPVVVLVNRFTVSATGLMIPAALPIGLCMTVLGMILLLLSAVILVKTAKIGKITPIRAIRGGAEDIYFKSRFTTPIGKRGLGMHLALRQLVSGKKQYISACFVTALLVFFLSLSGRIDDWMGSDGEGMMKSFNTAYYDIGILCGEDTAKDVETLITSYSAIETSYQLKITNASINNIEYVMNVISDPENYNILEGRTCNYENEIVITELVGKEQEIGIGDTVTINCGEGKEEFIITGIYQCANDMGANFGIGKDGFLRLLGDGESGFFTYYQLENPSAGKEIYDKLAAVYGDRITIDENTWSGLESIIFVMEALEIFMYVITIIFIFVVIIMTGSKILYKEQHDLGIYKSLGFTSGKLRLTFSLRFGIIAAAGSVIGIGLSGLITDTLVGELLKICGIYNFSSSLNLLQMLIPAVWVAILFVLFAYVSAGKIKKVEPGILIAE